MRAWVASKGVRRTEPEFELRDALGQSGCAICRLALRTAVRQLDILSYENVNDLDLRARLRAARGFCNRHAWQLLEQTRDPLGVALIYKDVINTLVPELRPDRVIERLAAPLRGHGAGRLASRLAATRECPVCLAERETEDVYLRLLGARVAEPSFREAWEHSSGLCWPHLLACLPRARSDEALGLLAKWQPGRSPESAVKSQGSRSAGSLAQSPSQSEQAREAKGSGQAADSQSTLRALALSHGRWSAGRSQLPPDLVVDLHQRKLETITRPAGDVTAECYVCREVATAMEGTADSESEAGVDTAALATICERHAWRLAARGGARLGVPLAMLAARRREALSGALEHALAERPALVPPGRAAAALIGEQAVARLRGSETASAAGCRLCAREAALDRQGTASAVAMVRSVALCRRHLMVASRPESSARRDWSGLLVHQADRWRALSAHLAEFIRKHDYRFAQEVRGEERDSPWRAVEEIAGGRG